MHVAGTFSEQIYPSLFRVFKTELPSFPYVQELLGWLDSFMTSDMALSAIF